MIDHRWSSVACWCKQNHIRYFSLVGHVHGNSPRSYYHMCLCEYVPSTVNLDAFVLSVKHPIVGDCSRLFL